jgi:tetratricopeptide (TPR) repeat protein
VIRWTVLAATLAVAVPAVARAEPAAAPRGDPAADAWRASYLAEGRGELAAALAALDRAGPGAGGYVGALRRGWLLYLAGQHAPAAEQYARALQLEPRAVEARLGAMLPLMALRRWKDAERMGEEALSLAPGDLAATARLAAVHYGQGRWPLAEALYRRAVGAFPASAEMRAGLGWSLLKQGRSREARAELERVLAFAPDHASAREGLALLP